jgi:predicted branched-subunit amino acid permease
MSRDGLARLVRHPEFARGAREMAGIAAGLAAWGLVAGVAMSRSSLGTGLSVLMSLLVFAGSAQLAAVPLIASGAPVWVIWATACCVNLRFVIFSAQWRPYLISLPRWQRALMAYFSADLNYVRFMHRFPQPAPQSEQLPYFWGGCVVNWCAWQGSSISGILLADRIPTAWGLGFAGTLALLAMVYTLVKSRATLVAAVVAGAAAVAAFALPFKLNIVVAIAAAVAVGVVIDAQTGALPDEAEGDLPREAR